MQSITISVNGEIKTVDAGLNIHELIKALNYTTVGFAVAINTTFVPIANYEITQIKHGDTIDILSPGSKEDEMTPKMNEKDNQWEIGGKTLKSRLLIGSALYPSPAMMEEAIRASEAQIVTVALRRQSAGQNAGNSFWDIIKSLNIEVLPNTAGCHSAKEAITTAMMAREVFGTHWIKLEVIGDQYNLQPDPFETVKAAETLIKEGFEVFPYTTDDLVVAKRLADAGCQIIMPWGSMIGSGKGLMNPMNLEAIRKAFPDLKLIIDAGIGKPSHAIQAMELGYDGVLLNSAVALAQDPVTMAKGFKYAIEAGRLAYELEVMQEREFASPSTPTVGTPFWHQFKA